MKNPFLLLTLLAVLTTACEKENKSFTQISGVVYERGHPNAKPIANALVHFEWRIKGTYGAEVHFIDTVRTNNQGQYTLAAETSNKDLHVYATAVNHYPGGELTMMPNVKRGKKQTVNLDLIPYAWVRMNIKKTGAYDRMGINTLAGGNRNFLAYSDTIIISRCLGNEQVTIPTFKYFSFDDPPHTVQYTIQTIGHDTVDISIDF